MKAAAGGPAGFPWDDVMATGFGLLRLSPAVFWAMTPREFAAATRVFAGAMQAPGRDELAALMRDFPDESA